MIYLLQNYESLKLYTVVLVVTNIVKFVKENNILFLSIEKKISKTIVVYEHYFVYKSNNLSRKITLHKIKFISLTLNKYQYHGKMSFQFLSQVEKCFRVIFEKYFTLFVVSKHT